MGRVRILLADDHNLVLEVFKRLLEPEFEIVACVPDARTLLSVAPALKPDIILLDLEMQESSGMQAGEQLFKLLPGAKLIALTMDEDPMPAREALHHWASGCLLKKSAASEVSMAIRDVHHGKRYVTESIAVALHNDIGAMHAHNKALTQRQREVLQLLAEGLTMREAAVRLQVTPRTVAFHKYRIMKDFSLRTNSDLVRFAIREGIIANV
jgi:DNA-binding NarL/FixJ family response regulator